jgi:hypothetical protein
MRLVLHNYFTEAPSFTRYRGAGAVRDHLRAERVQRTKDCGSDCQCDTCQRDHDRMPLKFRNADQDALYSYADLSASKLQAAYSKQQAENSQLNSEMIMAGRGYEKPTETRTKSDSLAKRVNAASDRHNALVEEMRRRQRFSGTLKPLPEAHRQSFLA